MRASYKGQGADDRNKLHVENSVNNVGGKRLLDGVLET
jgi:hypothetical protein